MGEPFRQVCVLLRDQRVLASPGGGLRSYEEDDPWDDLDRRARACGDPGAVLVAPQFLIESEQTLLLSVFGSRDRSLESSDRHSWVAINDLMGVEPAVIGRLRETARVVAGSTPPPPRRPEWFTRAWYDEADAWIDRQLENRGRSRSGPSVVVKAWSLSVVLMVPCGRAPVWFKAACRHFRAEPALTQLISELQPLHAPPMIATDDRRGWLLMEDLPGADEKMQDASPPGLGAAAAEIVADLQLRSIDHLDQFAGAGVPVRGLEQTLRDFDEILIGSVELADLTDDEVAAARAMSGEVHAAMTELAALGLPETLVHGDLHPGNVAQGDQSVVLYDWSDAAISHPFLDLIHLTRSLADHEADAARRRYLDVWRAAYPGADLARAVELATHVNDIFQMATFEQIYRAQEADSYWEMRGVVSRTLRRLPSTFPRHT